MAIQLNLILRVNSYNYQLIGGVDSKRHIVLNMERNSTAHIRFYDDSLAPIDDFHNGNTYYMNLPNSMFQDTIDMLRNESPVSFFPSNKKYLLFTGSEPIGEGE